MHEAEVVCRKASHLFSNNKSSLEDEKRKEAEYYINQGTVGSSHPNHNT